MYHAGRLLSCLRNRHQLILFRYRYNSYFPLLQAIRYGQYGSDFYRTLVGHGIANFRKAMMLMGVGGVGILLDSVVNS